MLSLSLVLAGARRCSPVLAGAVAGAVAGTRARAPARPPRRSRPVAGRCAEKPLDSIPGPGRGARQYG
ncbi:hypothetical protein GCM10018782_41030 [Streptomyces griseoaurantiacus]|nr:hypothetical protein GCM10018782_41030 [Streptomyces griseoaurantiacus]